MNLFIIDFLGNSFKRTKMLPDSETFSCAFLGLQGSLMHFSCAIIIRGGKTDLKYIKNFKFKAFLTQLDETNLFIGWYDTQPISAKIGFYSALILAFLTHIIMYSTLIIEEHLPGFYRGNWGVQGQRWFHHRINSLNFYYMNWVIGLMQALFLALTVFIIIKAFDIKNKLYALLIAGVMVTFPAIAETNLFFHDAAPYFFAVFISLWAFYITKLYKLGWVAGSILIMLGLAIYQSKISVAMVVSIIHLILYVTKHNPKFVDMVKYTSRFLFLIVGGLVAYTLSFEIFGFDMGDHRGMDGVLSRDTLRNLPEDILRVYQEVYYYFFSTLHDGVHIFRIQNRFLMFSYLFVFLLGFISFILALKNISKNILNICIVYLMMLLLPLAANFSRLFDIGHISALVMTSYAFAFFLILPLLIWDNLKINLYGAGKLVCVALIFIIGYYISFSNFIYLRGEALTAHQMHLSNRIAARVEPLLPYSEHNQLFLIGNLISNPLYPTRNHFSAYTPRTTVDRAFGQSSINGFPDHFMEHIMRYRLGINVLHGGNSERRQYLLDAAITYGTPVWPQEGAVTLIDGTVVGVMHFFGRVDIEEVRHNHFIAVLNHTGKASDLSFGYVWYIYRDGQRVDQIYIDNDGRGYVEFQFEEPGIYQFRVFLRFADSWTNIINNFSPQFEVR